MMIYKHNKSGICFVCMLFCGIHGRVFVMEKGFNAKKRKSFEAKSFSWNLRDFI